MKPKDLKCPFTWENRRPLVSDRVFYVPSYYQDHSDFELPHWSSAELFGREAPLEVEFCSGNGAWIIDKAQTYPDRNWLAVELQFDRVRKIWSKCQNLHLSNLIVVCGEALTFLTHYVRFACFSSLYVNFPDPWPKEKHEKNRLLKTPFFDQIARCSLPGACLTVVTDHADYANSTIEGLQQHSLWETKHPFPHYIDRVPDYGSSYFSDLWKEQGLSFHYMQYERVL